MNSAINKNSSSWSLRIKITVLVGLIVTAACVFLTSNSIFSAKNYYSTLIEPYNPFGAETLQPETYKDQLSGAANPDMVSKEPSIQPNAELESVPETGSHGDLPPRFPENSLPVPEGELYRDEVYMAATQQFSTQVLLVMLCTVAFAIALTYWSAGRVLTPLSRLTSSIGDIDETSLNRRVSSDGASGEVLLLTETFNGMMERLEGSFLVQKQFAANAAHELKTPLSIVKTSLQVLEMDEEPSAEDYREFISDTKQSITRLAKTVDSLMALADESALYTEDAVDINSLLMQVCSDLAGLSEEKKLTVSLSGEGRTIKTNRPLLYRIFFNLIENAIKYTPAGGAVSVDLNPDGPDCSSVLVRISDTGIGMSQESISHIFEPFYRADVSRSQKIPGAGLGLSIVRMIVDRFGGSVTFSSTPGKGTSAEVRLPCGSDMTATLPPS